VEEYKTVELEEEFILVKREGKLQFQQTGERKPTVVSTTPKKGEALK